MSQYLEVQTVGHWGGDPDSFAESLMVRIDGADRNAAVDLATLSRVLRQGGAQALRLLAERAEELEGQPATERPFML